MESSQISINIWSKNGSCIDDCENDIPFFKNFEINNFQGTMETLDEYVAAVVILAVVKSAIELLELCLEVFSV